LLDTLHALEELKLGPFIALYAVELAEIPGAGHLANTIRWKIPTEILGGS